MQTLSDPTPGAGFNDLPPIVHDLHYDNAPMETTPLLDHCDLNGDGHCDIADIDFIETRLGSCRDQSSYHPDADVDADGCVTQQDQQLLFPDTDGDGVPDITDGCSTDPVKTIPGVCGCGTPDTDSDGDGVPDCQDVCPTDSQKTAPGVCGCGVADTDSDSDGMANCHDNCPTVANPDQKDSNSNGKGDACEGQNLASLFGNGGFEADILHSQWTATTSNKTYKLNAPMVNPAIVSQGGVNALQAPTGKNFIGILNPKDQNISGKLVHTAVTGPFPAGTAFQVTVFANRGRLAGAKTALFDTSPSEVLVQFFGWGAGKLPTINSNTDNWSRQPSVRQGQAFTNWAGNGQWASLTFQFVAEKDLNYISLSIAGMNHKNASYVAFDVE